MKNEMKLYTLPMSAAPQSIPAGFTTVGTISADGVQFTSDSAYDLGTYAKAREARFDITLEGQNPELMYQLFGMRLESVKPVRWYRRAWNTLKRKARR